MVRSVSWKNAFFLIFQKHSKIFFLYEISHQEGREGKKAGKILYCSRTSKQNPILIQMNKVDVHSNVHVQAVKQTALKALY